MSKYIIECDECLSTYIVIVEDNDNEDGLTPENCCMCNSLISAELLDDLDTEESLYWAPV